MTAPRTKPDTRMAHTPGPWELVSLSGYGSPFSIRMAYQCDNPNASKTHYGVQSVRRREDATLIAAAPELLAACDTAFDFLGGVDGAVEIREVLLAAIAKATGAKP
jgi:hypothetical protein